MDWQSIITYAVVALAVLWAARRIWRTIQVARAKGGPPPGCSSCSQFTGADAPRARAKPLVQLAPRKNEGK